MNECEQKSLINFKKANSLIEKIIEMVEKDSHHPDIMQQYLAVIGLLNSSHRMLIRTYLDIHLGKTFGSDKKKQKVIDEILQAIKLSNKL